MAFDQGCWILLLTTSRSFCQFDLLWENASKKRNDSEWKRFRTETLPNGSASERNRFRTESLSESLAPFSYQEKTVSFLHREAFSSRFYQAVTPLPLLSCLEKKSNTVSCLHSQYLCQAIFPHLKKGLKLIYFMNFFSVFYFVFSSSSSRDILVIVRL